MATYTGTSGADFYTGTASDDQIDGQGGNDTLIGANGNDDLTGGTGSDSLNGGTGSDTLWGGEYNANGDYIDTEVDTLVGGADDDFYVVGNATDVIIENPGGGVDTVVLINTAITEVTLSSEVENFQTTTLLASNSVANLSSAHLSVIGNASNNRIWGTGGNNLLDGGNGGDSLFGANGNDDLTGGAGSDSLNGGTGNDTLWGGEYDAGGDYIDTEVDTLVGGADDDFYIVGNATDVIIENPGGGIDTVVLINTAITEVTLSSEVENFQTTTLIASNPVANLSSANLNVIGNASNNRIWGTGGNNLLYGGNGGDSLFGANGNDDLTGGAGSDSLNGGSGNDSLWGGEYDAGGDYIDTELDTLVGGLGDDFYIVGNNTDVITESAGGGVDTVVLINTAITEITLNSEVENFQTTTLVASTSAANLSSANLNVIGNVSNNRIWGTAGANQLSGGDGNDTLHGANGNDTLDGGLGDDSLNGGSGADRMAGGKGNDSYNIDSTGDTVVESETDAEGSSNGAADTIVSSIGFSLTDTGTHAGVEHLTLTGTGNLLGAGNKLDNILTGNQGNNNLSGAAGNDTLDGGLGTDSMAGGTGDDTFMVDNAGDVVVEYFNQGTDTVLTALGSFQLSANVERLILTGTSGQSGQGNELDNGLQGSTGNDTLVGLNGFDLLEGGQGNDVIYGDDTLAGSTMANDDYLFGQDGSDTLYGGGGNDLLDGGTGADSMVGGSGDDVYYVDSASDVVVEASGGGIDTVYTSLSNYTLTPELENLELISSGADFMLANGNALDNQIVGSAGADIIAGRGGNDSLYGGWGDDGYSFGAADGQDYIFDDGDTVADGDTAVFTATNYQQLWFSQAANGSDLEISIIGTNNKVTVGYWFDSEQYQVELIQAKGGSGGAYATLDHSQVDALVSAMASMTPPPPGQTTLTAQQLQTLSPTLAATWTV